MISDSLTLEKVKETFEKVQADYKFDEIRLALITQDFYDATCDIISNHFTPDEPLCQAFGVSWDKAFQDGEMISFLERGGIDEAIHLETLGVHKTFRRMEYGGLLIRTAVALGRELGFKAITGEGTSNFSQRIFEKETLAVMPYDSYIYKGHPIIKGTGGEHKLTKMYGVKF